MSDEPDRQDLEDRVEQLESTIAKMLPSRRDALKLGGAALVGGAAMSGGAAAQAGTEDGEAGTIGTPGAPVDLESQDIDNADTINTQNILPKNIGNGYHYAAAFDGSDADARLTNAINASSKGDIIFLESADYTQDRNLSNRSIIGTGTRSEGTTIKDARFTMSSFSKIQRVNLDITDGSVGLDFNFETMGAQIYQSSVKNGTIVVNGSGVMLTRIRRIDITLNSGGNVVDSCVNLNVTDNGNGNVVGDIS